MATLSQHVKQTKEIFCRANALAVYLLAVGESDIGMECLRVQIPRVSSADPILSISNHGLNAWYSVKQLVTVLVLMYNSFFRTKLYLNVPILYTHSNKRHS